MQHFEQGAGFHFSDDAQEMFSVHHHHQLRPQEEMRRHHGGGKKAETAENDEHLTDEEILQDVLRRRQTAERTLRALFNSHDADTLESMGLHHPDSFAAMVEPPVIDDILMRQREYLLEDAA